MHGTDRSEALTRAAQKLSAAREYLNTLKEEGVGRESMERAWDRVETAEMAYKAAYKAYTNPFGVVKTA